MTSPTAITVDGDLGSVPQGLILKGTSAVNMYKLAPEARVAMRLARVEA